MAYASSAALPAAAWSDRPEPQPDFSALADVLRRRGRPGRLPLYDLFSNITVPVLKAIGHDPGEPPAAGEEEQAWAWSMQTKIQYQLLLGYDYVDVWGHDLKFWYPGPARAVAGTREGNRGYITSTQRAIAARADFERYPWPDLAAIMYARLETMAAWLPPGMKIIVHSRGVLETTMDLLGHQDICYQLYDDPDLVRDVFARVGTAFLEFHTRAAVFPAVGAAAYCDDMGFRTQTLLAPETYRELLFPWHQRIVAAVHAQGKPILLHACGNLAAVMEDIIACGWDAKQSFEDSIQPIWEAQNKYGNRICLLGGFDIDKLCRMTISEVRAHTRWLKAQCPENGWALGTGNSVPNYIPVEHFLAMIDEGLRLRKR